MLMKAYEYAASNQDAIVRGVNLSLGKEIMREAKSLWNSYTPNLRESQLAGIDSSWNFIPYQGFYLFAVEAVSILRDCSYTVEPLFNLGVGTLSVEENGEIVYDPRTELQSRGMEFEYELAMGSVKKSDFALIDGSVLARFYDRRKRKPTKFYEYARELMGQENVVFISKTSSSNIMLGGILGDIFYFNHVGSLPGYSKPYFDNVGVTIFYVRLSDNTPCIRVEAPGKISESEAERLIDILQTSSVSGYPYVLRLAHEQCKVTNDDLERLANMLGLNAEIGGRDVLGE